jgi:hypothetical protein
MRIITLALLLSSTVLAASAIDWEQAERDIERLSPATFRELPKDIIARLSERGCKVPQPNARTQLYNVVSGAFAKADQSDWAVLCSRNGMSSLLIFWGGEARCASEIARSEDRGWLQDTGAGAGYSRVISVVDKVFIEQRYAAHGGPKPLLIDHHGIDDAFVEKGSTVHYCHQGRWLELPGSD